MIIDSHCHLTGEGWSSDELALGAARFSAALIERMTGVYPNVEQWAAQLVSMAADTKGERLIASMDAAGVAKACVFTADFGLATAARPRVSIEDQNRLIVEASERFPGRLIPFFAIDPRRPDGLQMFERALKEGKVRGLKLHPTAGYFPHDPVCYPYYRKCVDRGIPVVVHTGGSIPSPLKARFSLPIYLDDVAADLPDLSIIMAHAGAYWWEEALAVALFKPNVYLDVSGWQMVFTQTPGPFYEALRRILDTVGPWRVFYGTDTPYFDAMLPMDRWVKAFKEPDPSACPHIKFTREEMEIVLGKAFARLMKLDQATITE